MAIDDDEDEDDGDSVNRVANQIKGGLRYIFFNTVFITLEYHLQITNSGVLQRVHYSLNSSNSFRSHYRVGAYAPHVAPTLRNSVPSDR